MAMKEISQRPSVIAGHIYLEGLDVTEIKPKALARFRRENLGFVFQDFNLLDTLTISENIALALAINKKPAKEVEPCILDIAGKLNISDILNKYPYQVSGGQKQRCACARAIVNHPKLLLADEPTGALDSKTSVQIMDLLKKISKDKLIIMVTHNEELAKTYSTRVIKLLDGEVLEDSNPYHSNLEETEKMQTKKIAMSFKTALSLSFNNLLTKKGRTILTAIAGSKVMPCQVIQLVFKKQLLMLPSLLIL